MGSPQHCDLTQPPGALLVVSGVIQSHHLTWVTARPTCITPGFTILSLGHTRVHRSTPGSHYVLSSQQHSVASLRKRQCCRLPACAADTFTSMAPLPPPAPRHPLQS
ncbi:hypothetical protein AAFF_G00285330 [Aldrovandia affinis]|uniref:Uncharacterized protein n=1 Tax=Aldrovandia affinis TaxID=143900 RepID=A0AAD7TBV6_9TELE|nr:hypothetical protein AAFF_G00285330 [Aldrovandia affinis]